MCYLSLDCLCVVCVTLFLLDFLLCGLFFFFQAEDGIRDAQESRVLGDVYKRQKQEWHLGDDTHVLAQGRQIKLADVDIVDAVSYTHLTLPTIYTV